MASLGHIAIGCAAGRLEAGTKGTRRLALSMTLWAGLSLLPDADVLAFSLGIPYGAPWGHRGASHSLVMALALGLAVALVARAAGERFLPAFALASCVVASHGLLDTLTDGGHGVALLWPFSEHRFFAPWRPIPVAPLGTAFLSARGLHCVLVELAMFSPALLYAWWPRRRADATRA